MDAPSYATGNWAQGFDRARPFAPNHFVQIAFDPPALAPIPAPVPAPAAPLPPAESPPCTPSDQMIKVPTSPPGAPRKTKRAGDDLPPPAPFLPVAHATGDPLVRRLRFDPQDPFEDPQLMEDDDDDTSNAGGGAMDVDEERWPGPFPLPPAPLPRADTAAPAPAPAHPPPLGGTSAPTLGGPGRRAAGQSPLGASHWRSYCCLTNSACGRLFVQMTLGTNKLFLFVSSLPSLALGRAGSALPPNHAYFGFSP